MPLSSITQALADDQYDLNDIGTVKRGDRDVELSADLDDPDLYCKIKIKFADGFVLTADKVQADKKGKCKVKVNMPDSKIDPSKRPPRPTWVSIQSDNGPVRVFALLAN